MSREFSASRSSPPFPSYLLPSLQFSLRPFRARQPSSASVSSESSAPSLSSSVDSASSIVSSPTSFDYLDSHGPYSPQQETGFKLSQTQPSTLKCANCATDVAFSSQIVSKGFTGRHGRAYLVSPVQPSSTAHPYVSQTQTSTELLNTRIGRPANRQLVTGAHVVADISCRVCAKIIGWKYVDARETSQRYKIGKFILETKRVVPSANWEDVSEADEGFDAAPWLAGSSSSRIVDSDHTEVAAFDSDDDDECDELFAGIWNAETVAKRRSHRLISRQTHGTA